MKIRKNAEKGFSLIELVLVVAIVLIVAAMAIPSVVAAMYNVRMRSSAYSLAGILQTARIQAIKSNSERYVCQATGSDKVTRVWVQDVYTCVTIADLQDPSKGLALKYTQITLGGTVSIVPAKGTGEPTTTLSVTNLGFGPPPNATVGAIPIYNSRGIPCYKTSSTAATCPTTVPTKSSSSGVSQLWYLTDTRPGGSKGWAAVAVSPAGRVQIWMFDGTKWNR